MTQGNEKRSNTVAGIAMRVGTIAVFMVSQAALLFGSAGRLDWSWAWVYVGYTLQYPAMPCLLVSLWALPPWLAAAISMVIRTALEDRMLHAELPGYQEYARQVRYRLAPGIW